MTCAALGVRWSALLAAGLWSLGMACQAEPAATSKNVHLRAGPGRSYPVVAILPARAAVDVQGCIRRYTWCDVYAGDVRGWVYAGNLVYPYEGSEVPIVTYGAVVGIAVVDFVLLDYWHDYYRDRPWYPHRYYWVRRVPPPPPHGLPPPVRPGPPGRYPPPVVPRPPPPGGHPPPPGGHPPPPGGHPAPPVGHVAPPSQPPRDPQRPPRSPS